MPPCLIRRLTPNGLKTVDYTADSLTEAAQYEPDDGIYTVANTFDTYKTLKLDAHLDRLEDSARRADIPLRLDPQRLKSALRQMIDEADFGSVRFRITVPRAEPDVFILSIEPFMPISPELIVSGVRVMTVPNSARHNALAKTTDWMHARQKIVETMDENTYDAILLNANGDLLEGLGANFYAILNGELRTAGDEVLPGISRQIVYEVAPDILSLRTEAVNVTDLPQLEEAFITSSSRGIVPVVQIDDVVIGNGTPGERTMQLRRAYDEWVTANLEVL